jgi:hypothetical protein
MIDIQASEEYGVLDWNKKACVSEWEQVSQGLSL